MKSLKQLLEVLVNSNIDFVLIGGYASVVHGSNYLTRDIDICAALTPENIQNMREALRPFNPINRMNPNFKPSFDEHPESLTGLNAIYLETDLGILDILKEVKGVGNFEEIKENSTEIKIFGQQCKVISLDDLIKAKETMGRDKDRIVLNDLYLIKKENS